MSRLSAKVPGPFALVTLAAALLGACYDMPLIPEGSPAVGGSAGRAGGSTSAGRGGASAGRGGGAGGAPPGSSGATHTDGGTTPNGDGGASAGDAGRSNAGAAGTTSQAGSSGAPQITWLELIESAAPSSSSINEALGIQGSFYAYGDGCSQLVWDEKARCASGKLCDPENLDNWGIAIGFDFRNTGADGTPSDTKLTWDPRDVGALGVAWRVRGTAPKLQVWVLNMAPSWQGQCSVMSCEIDGPPDGVAPAALDDQLSFDHMMKDDWGGSGERYTFNPADTHALQFKIATVKVGAAAFNFCIDALGIVR